MVLFQHSKHSHLTKLNSEEIQQIRLKIFTNPQIIKFIQV